MKLKILIVDDNENIRALLHATLDLAGAFDVHEALDGPAAVALAATLQPNLVLMDIMMPGAFEGDEACRQIKAAALAAGIAVPKVILISAKPVDQIRADAQTCGADLFITKPFGPAQLVDAISNLYRPA